MANRGSLPWLLAPSGPLDFTPFPVLPILYDNTSHLVAQLFVYMSYSSLCLQFWTQ